ncbi:SDR family oxidoreductase [Nocardia concava]|uniref:SDR family oxidoreductase n=1 Tax=Nocardia concava TaxID=257281 RepID=UPI00031F792B|nr:SDR family oxidoreductase [Nocardia concava]
MRTVSCAGQVVVVTGGARGIGRATAAAFLAAGAKVVIGDIDTELVARTAIELGARPSAQVIGLPVDVTDPGSLELLFDSAEASFGPVDVLVNNAGIMPTGLFAEEGPEMTRRIIDINVHGVINGSRLAVERFRRRGRGHLVNLASLAGVQGFPGLATYCASKHAVVGFTESLYLELAESGIHVTAILPGVVRTELSAGGRLPHWMAALSTVDPEDVADAIVAAIGTGRLTVTVPGRLAAIIGGTRLLPLPARILVGRLTGATTLWTRPDADAREHYHRRIRGE